MSARARRRSRMSIRYFDDSILLTETHAWGYYRLPTHAYEFTTPAEREALAINITVALAAIRLPEAEVHLRIAHRSYPAAQWAARLDATSVGGPGWRDYLDEMYQHVWTKDFWAKEVYLGVRPRQRGMRAQPRCGGGPGARGRSRRCARGRCTTAGRCCTWSSPRASRGRRSCPSPGSPT